MSIFYILYKPVDINYLINGWAIENSLFEGHKQYLMIELRAEEDNHPLLYALVLVLGLG